MPSRPDQPARRRPSPAAPPPRPHTFAPRLPRPPSVWALPPHPEHLDCRLLPPWLTGAIIKIIALYTPLGHRVLLLAPPEDPSRPPLTATSNRRGTVRRRNARSGPARGLLPGLREAAQSASRLHRHIHTRLAPPTRESGPGLRLQSDPSALPRPADPPTGSPDPARPGDDPDSYDAVIAIVDPTQSDWTTTHPWNTLVRPRGILAFITHSDHAWGQMIDPSSHLTAAAHRAGLAALDRVILLEVPLHNGAPAPGSPPEAPGAGDSRRVHSDLLLFARPGPQGDA